MSSPQGTVDHPARGAYHLFVGNFSYTLLVAIASIVIARLLGPADYGLYSLALVIPSYLYTVVQLGFNQAAIFYSAKYRSEGSVSKAYEFILSITFFQLAVSGGAILLLIPLSADISRIVLDRPELTYLMPVALATVLGHVGYYTISGGMQGLNKMNWSAILQVLLAIIKLVVSVGLVLLGFSVFGAVLGNAAAFLVSGFSGLLIVLLLYKKPFPNNFSFYVKSALTYSTPLYIAGLVGGMVGPIQSTLLALFVSNQEIGGFSAAGNLGALITLFVFPITTVLFPLFSTIREDRARLLETYRISTKYSTLIIVPLTMFLMALATQIASAVYHTEYSFSGNYLRVLLLPNLLVGLGSMVQASLLSSTMRNRAWMASSVVGSIVSVGIAAIAVRYLGVYGVIAGNVAGQVVTLMLAWPFVTQAIGGNADFGSVWRIYLSSAVAAAFCYPISYIAFHPVMVSGLALLLFFAVLVPMLVLTGAVSPKDVENLDSYFRRVRPAYIFFRLARKYYQLFTKS